MNETAPRMTDPMDDTTATGNGHQITVAPTQAEEKKQSGMFGWLRRLLAGRHDTSLREAIEELIEEKEQNESEFSIAMHEKMLISNILNLRDLPVIDVMVPRADIVAIDIETSLEDLFRLLAEKPHSRLPVYEEDLDNIVGAVHMKDIVATTSGATDAKNLKDIVRNVLIVSPAMRVLDLLLQMRQSRVHIALVIDEFGGIDGLITINDLIEAVVGEIDDEHDLDIQPQLIERPDGSILVDARYPLDEFEERYGELVDEDEREDIDTMGGLVNAIAGHVPTRGEIVKHGSGLEFEIIDADPRRINRIRIRQAPPSRPLDEE